MDWAAHFLFGDSTDPTSNLKLTLNPHTQAPRMRHVPQFPQVPEKGA